MPKYTAKIVRPIVARKYDIRSMSTFEQIIMETVFITFQSMSHL